MFQTVNMSSQKTTGNLNTISGRSPPHCTFASAKASNSSAHQDSIHPVARNLATTAFYPTQQSQRLQRSLAASKSPAACSQNAQSLRRHMICDQSVSGITHLLMPGQLLPEDGSLEDYKNELKECLRENIHHKREIKQLRQQRKDQDIKQSLMEKENEDAKLGQAAEIQKAVRKVDMRNR